MSAPLRINASKESYPIYFGVDLSAEVAAGVNAAQQAGRKVVAITDERVGQAQSSRIQRMVGGALQIVVPAGESSKSVDQLKAIWDGLAAAKLDRSGLVLAIGGGVVGDLAGFAAASFLRGVEFVQVPTTLLAMVDSSVGGKTGINLPAGKNLVGAFHQPSAVYVDIGFLHTLPAREFAAGMAEVIKYGLLGDADLFVGLEQVSLTPTSDTLAEVVRRCCAAKAAIVEADEFETAASGGRALLNLGHTFGHAIEKVAGYSVYLHGEAVAIGLAAAARLSRDLGLVDASVVERVDQVVSAHHLPIALRGPLEVGDLMSAMASDKKVRAGQLRFVVMEAIGRTVTRDDVPAETVESVWREVGAA